MLKLLPLIFLSFLLGAPCLNAQNILVSGIVSSAVDGKPMPYVSIVVKGTNNAASTDMDGNYTLQNVLPEDTLLFSFVGYFTQRIKAGSQHVINVKLQPSHKELGEVVVTALGINRQKREIPFKFEGGGM